MIWRSGKYRILRRTEQPDPPKVLAVYPTAKAIPANLLKFYIYFSEPMREGREVFDLIRIVDSKGRTVEAPWRQVELWDADARRLTLWIHPVRIKRGVSLRQMTGAVLRAGEEYQLVVDERVQAMSGAALKKAYSHRFRAIPEDRSAPAPGDWKMEIPMAGSRRELQVSASESFDHVLWKRHQWIEDARGRRVKVSCSLVKRNGNGGSNRTGIGNRSISAVCRSMAGRSWRQRTRPAV